jgi:hypothetical protein
MMAFIALLAADSPLVAQIAVRHTEGLVHGFLLLRSTEGEPLADGDLTQGMRGNRVTSHMVFRFKDGSVNDETTVFSERGNFRLLNYHLVQKGPAFPHPLDMSIDTASGEVTVRYIDDDGKEKTSTESMRLPPDLANGMISILLKNVHPGESSVSMSMVVATPKPRLVKLDVAPTEEEPFSVGGSRRKSMHFVLKFEVGGLPGVVATLLGKKPPDIHVWILGGEAPAFIKSESQLYVGGPIWQIRISQPSMAAKCGSGLEKLTCALGEPFLVQEQRCCRHVAYRQYSLAQFWIKS